MIGMSQIKRKFYTGLGIGFGVSIIVLIVVIFISTSEINSYKNGTNEEYNNTYMQDIVVVVNDIMQGEIIKEEDLVTKKVHRTTVPAEAFTSISKVKGKVAKYNLSSGAPVTGLMCGEEIMPYDIRLQEVNTVLIPSDLVEGDYVDVRLMFANGTDYIVLAEKQVMQIAGQTMWFELSENERMLLNSAIVDSFLNEGSKLYATEYIEPTSQIRAEDEEDKKDEEDEEDEEEDSYKKNNEFSKEAYVREELEELIENNLSELYVAETMLPIIEYNDVIENGEVTENTEDLDNEDDLYDLNDSEDDENIEDSVVETTEPEIDQEALKKEKEELVQKIYEFIATYNNLTAMATQTEVTYQPNEDIMYAMSVNPNISVEARKALEKSARENIENMLNSYYSENELGIDNIVNGANESIEEQKNQREYLLGEE